MISDFFCQENKTNLAGHDQKYVGVFRHFCLIFAIFELTGRGEFKKVI
jgi:hypothetical protein